MTKDQAIEAMRQGQKVTHPYFIDGEWARMIEDDIVLEDGVQQNIEEFFNLRRSAKWNVGWQVVDATSHNNEGPAMKSKEQIYRELYTGFYKADYDNPEFIKRNVDESLERIGNIDYLAMDAYATQQTASLEKEIARLKSLIRALFWIGSKQAKRSGKYSEEYIERLTERSWERFIESNKL